MARNTIGVPAAHGELPLGRNHSAGPRLPRSHRCRLRLPPRRQDAIATLGPPLPETMPRAQLARRAVFPGARSPGRPHDRRPREGRLRWAHPPAAEGFSHGSRRRTLEPTLHRLFRHLFDLLEPHLQREKVTGDGGTTIVFIFGIAYAAMDTSVVGPVETE